jgi:hypothetical protein
MRLQLMSKRYLDCDSLTPSRAPTSMTTPSSCPQKNEVIRSMYSASAAPSSCFAVTAADLIPFMRIELSLNKRWENFLMASVSVRTSTREHTHPHSSSVLSREPNGIYSLKLERILYRIQRIRGLPLPVLVWVPLSLNARWFCRLFQIQSNQPNQDEKLLLYYNNTTYCTHIISSSKSTNSLAELDPGRLAIPLSCSLLSAYFFARRIPQ